jgi:hypothetical protein
MKKPLESWADVWNVEGFPGRRVSRKHPIDSMEQALLADGVAPDKLYPLDADRASKTRPDQEGCRSGGPARAGVAAPQDGGDRRSRHVERLLPSGH